MIKAVKIGSVRQLRDIVNTASRSLADVGIHDANGRIADAKSIMGLMSLDFSRPVHVVSEDPSEIERVLNAIRTAA